MYKREGTRSCQLNDEDALPVFSCQFQGLHLRRFPTRDTVIDTISYLDIWDSD